MPVNEASRASQRVIGAIDPTGGTARPPGGNAADSRGGFFDRCWLLGQSKCDQ